MDKAVEELFRHVGERTNHGARDLIGTMNAIARARYLYFNSEEERSTFVDIVERFEKYCEYFRKTSWGRNEFSEWWSTNTQPAPQEFRAECMSTPAPYPSGVSIQVEQLERDKNQRVILEHMKRSHEHLGKLIAAWEATLRE